MVTLEGRPCPSVKKTEGSTGPKLNSLKLNRPRILNLSSSGFGLLLLDLLLALQRRHVDLADIHIRVCELWDICLCDNGRHFGTSDGETGEASWRSAAWEGESLERYIDRGRGGGGGTREEAGQRG